jgi:hypothetical protein
MTAWFLQKIRAYADEHVLDLERRVLDAKRCVHDVERPRKAMQQAVASQTL